MPFSLQSRGERKYLKTERGVAAAVGGGVLGGVVVVCTWLRKEV